MEYGNDKGLFADDPSEIVVLWSISDTGRSIYSVFYDSNKRSTMEGSIVMLFARK